MENKVVNLKINSNFQEAEQQVKSLGNAIKVLDNEATNLDATFEEVYGDLKPLTARMGEAEDRLYELAKAGKQNTQEYKDLLKSVGEYKKVQQQTDLVVDAAAQTMGSKLSGSLNAAAGGFSLVQGSMALFGSESSQVEEAILKVQSAMAISQGVETINQGAKSVKALGESVKSYSIVQKAITAGQWLWNAAQAANPIGALVVAITALIAGGVALVNYFKSSAAESAANTKAVKDNEKALDNQTKTLERNSTEFSKKQSQELAMAKASGMSAAAIRALELKLIDEKIAYEQSARAIAFNTYEKNKNKLASLQAAGADADVIKSQQETTNKSILEYNKQNQNVQKAFDERKSIQNRHQVEVRQSQTDHNKEVQTKSNEAATKAKEELAAQKKKDAEDLKNALDAQKTSELAQRDEITKAIGEAQDKQAEANLSASEIEQRVVKDKYFNLIQLAKQQKRTQEEIDVLEAQRKNELKVITDKYRLEDDAKKAADLEKTIADASVSYENKLLAIEAEQALFQKQKDDQLITEEQFNDKTNNLSKSRIAIGEIETQAKIEQAQRGAALLNNISDLIGKDTAAGKVAAIAATTINTYAAAQAAFLNAQKNPISILGPAYPYISAGLAIAGGLKNVQSILSVPTPSGGGGGAPSGGGMGAGPTAPTFNVVGQGGANQIAQSISNQEQQPLKAYVVSNDVTTSQSLDRNITSNASMG
jgi:hypothetical protein